MAARFYTRDDVGPVCRFCHYRVPLALATDVHPSCGPEAAILLTLGEAS